MIHTDKPTAKQLLASITEAKPRCFYKSDDYMADDASREWATLICQDCPVLQQCRDYGDKVEHRRSNKAYLAGIYGGETPAQRSQRRRSTLEVRYATDRRSA